ncbi:hypothetical protein DCS32_04205 [Dokdonia sp. Dokd-P16]|uniref:GLPGLI family protein n=1 Tax=Dokdonia sp. Dokd-P16 TaxID=2173169 RepID=UPI000D545C6D|nr:GLPGLI family protein [Dokdonia sp. Dokd-P16]AWH73390.1 hypothetical protein DCS32_04205 [Dokdonia sp. Dokd-P16]
MKYFVLFLMLAQISQCFSQNYRVTYVIDNFNMNTGKSVDNSTFNSLEIAINEASSNINKVDFFLETNYKTSVFEGEERIALPNDPFNARELIITTVGFSGYVQSDFTEKFQYNQKSVLGKNFIIEKPIESKKWIITDEEYTILGKKCIKASTRETIKNSKGVFYREVDAYFTPDLTLQSGPGSYSGLPGLILKVEVKSKSVNYSISAKSIEKIKSFPLKDFKEKAISQEDFNKLLADRLSY